jgi:hypothetical protein
MQLQILILSKFYNVVVEIFCPQILFFGVFWGVPLAWMGRSLSIYVTQLPIIRLFENLFMFLLYSFVKNKISDSPIPALCNPGTRQLMHSGAQQPAVSRYGFSPQAPPSALVFHVTLGRRYIAT